MNRGIARVDTGGRVGLPRGVLSAAAALALATAAHAARTYVEAPLLVGADAYGPVAFSYGNNGVSAIIFAAQSPDAVPTAAAGSLLANSSVAAGAFTGNYLAARVQGVTFWISGDGQLPKGAELVLHGGSGRVWRNRNVELVSTAGVWVVNNIGMARSAGWDRNERPEVDKDALWAEDLQNVVAIGLRFAPAGLEAQTYTVRAFMLVGDNGFPLDPGPLTRVRLALLERFGVDSLNKLKSIQLAQDADGDRLSDVKEILAGTDPDDARSVFAAEIVEAGENGITLRWPCVAGEVYGVLRSSDLVLGFSPLVVGLKASQTGYMTYCDATAAGKGPYFYRIIKF